MVMSTSSRNKPFRSNSLLKFVIIAAFVLIIVVTCVLYINKQKELSDNSKITKATKIDDGLYVRASTTAVKNGADAGQSELDGGLENAKNNVEKAYVYCAKSSLAFSEAGGKNYDKALEFAKKAELLNPTASTAALIARVMVEKADKIQAIKFYQLAIDRLNSSKSAMDKADADYYKKLIEGLKNE